MRTRIAQALLAAAALVLASGLARGNAGPDAGRNRIPLPARMLSSALVLAAALALAGRGPAARLAAQGMACGLLGDLIMARVIPLPQHVIGGMLAFGVGHTCYIRAGLAHGAAQRPAPPYARGLAAGWLAALLGWRALAYTPAQPAPINAAALGYALLLGSMSGLGAALARHDDRQRGLAAGGALFLLSDLILAGELFRQLRFPHSGDVVWLTYLAGQALIVTGLAQPAAHPGAG